LKFLLTSRKLHQASPTSSLHDLDEVKFWSCGNTKVLAKVERGVPNARASLNRLISFHTSFTKINLAFTFWRSSGEVPGTSGEVLEKSLGLHVTSS
jgi:hypothetical protein